MIKEENNRKISTNLSEIQRNGNPVILYPIGYGWTLPPVIVTINGVGDGVTITPIPRIIVAHTTLWCIVILLVLDMLHQATIVLRAWLSTCGIRSYPCARSKIKHQRK